MRRSLNDDPTLEEIEELGPLPKKPQKRREITDKKADTFERVLDLESIRAEKANRHLNAFIKEAWHVIEPENPYVSNWHIDYICEALEALATGQIKDLLINVPPRHTKSMVSTVMFQPWVWTKWPHLRWIYSSYSATLSLKHSGYAKKVMQSRWYQRHFGDKYQITSEAIKEIENNVMGYRLTTSVGGMATGRGGDIIVVDDPHNVREAHSEIKREGVLIWWDQVMSTRAEGDPRNLRRMIIMQRVHDRDLSGHVLEQGGWTHLCLPMEFVKKSRCVVPDLGLKDPREEDGELLNPKRFDLEWVDKQKGANLSGRNPKLNRKMDSWAYAGQFQQDPVPLEGGMAKRAWFEAAFYKDDPMEIYEKSHKIYTSWDMSFKDEEEASGNDTSYVVGTVWGQIGLYLYLIHMFRAQIGFNETLKAFVKVHQDFPKAQEKLVEDRANGTAIMATMRKKVAGIIPVDTKNEPKTARYGSVLWLIEAGNVKLPDPELYPWAEVALDELCRFPKASRDDIVDSVTHALIRYAAFVIDPEVFPTGVGFGNRFQHETGWQAEDSYNIRTDTNSSWGVGRR